MPLPSVLWPTAQAGSGGTVVPVADLTSTAVSAAERNASVLAIGGVIPVIYGRHSIGARVATVVTDGSDLLLLCVIGRGPIDAIESASMDGAALPAGVTWTGYPGTLGQAAAPDLVAAFAAQGIVYADRLPGIAYAVVRIAQSASTGFPQLVFTVRGRLLLDDRTSTTGYTETPALALADFLRDTDYGCGLAVDADSVIDLADRCDESIGGESRRTIGLAIEAQASSGALINTLRAYAGCFVDRSGASVRLVPDAPAAVEMSFTPENIVEGSVKLRKRGIANTPTVVRVTWSDPEKDFADAEAEIALPGVLTGALDRLESSVPMPGVGRYSQAIREGTERLNKLWLADLEIGFGCFDEGLRLRVGAVIEVTHPIGLAGKAFRVTRLDRKGAGQWDVTGVEYDAAAYCDAVFTTPSTPDTELPSPLDPPAVSGLALTEEVFQLENGTWSSRIAAAWNASTWAYLSAYRVEMYKDGMLLAAAPASLPQWRSGAVQEGQMYTVRVQALSQFAAGSWSSASLLAAGKTLLPGNVPGVTGFEVGGEVRLTIAAATDLDMTGYEVRYGPVGCAWALSSTVKFVDFVNAASGVGGYVVYKDAPAGTWDFLVCARDSVGQYSPTPARITITVTLDVNSFLVDNHDFSAGTPTLTNMIEYSLPGDPRRYFVSEDGVAAATKFPGATASSYAAIAATYHNSMTSEFATNACDFGQALAGNWSGDIDSEALSGSVSDVLSLSSDGSAYADQAGLIAKTVARFGKLKSTALTTGTLKVTMPAATLRIDAIPRVEHGTVTTSASTYVTVTLANAYASVKAIVLTPLGSAAIHAVADAIVVGVSASFRVYAFNAAGAQVAASVMWEFQGV